MNNFVFSQDPLLFQTYQPKTVSQENYETRQKELNEMMNQYKQTQMPQSMSYGAKDYLGELDTLMKGLKKRVSETLISDNEYNLLNMELQSLIQEEIMSNVKWRINSNPKAIKNIEKQMELINREKEKDEDEERKNLNEINDYMKNYSNMTFDEYKKIKNKKK